MAYFRCMGNGGGISPILIPKNITENGTYNASSDNADGYSQVMVNVSGGGGAIERLFIASENSSSSRHTDHTHIAYFNDGTGTITEDANYSEYLSYNSSTRKFEVLRNFNAIIVPWTYNYKQAQSSYSKGQFYINDTMINSWTTGTTAFGRYMGIPEHIQLYTGDTFYQFTPSSDGYPEQNLKVYKADTTYTDSFTEELSVYNIMSPVTISGTYTP